MFLIKLFLKFQNRLSSLLKTAEDLHIKGLAEVSWRSDSGPNDVGNNSGHVSPGAPGVEAVLREGDSEESPVPNKRRRGRPPLDDAPSGHDVFTPKITCITGNVIISTTPSTNPNNPSQNETLATPPDDQQIAQQVADHELAFANALKAAVNLSIISRKFGTNESPTLALANHIVGAYQAGIKKGQSLSSNEVSRNSGFDANMPVLKAALQKGPANVENTRPIDGENPGPSNPETDGINSGPNLRPIERLQQLQNLNNHSEVSGSPTKTGNGSLSKAVVIDQQQQQQNVNIQPLVLNIKTVGSINASSFESGPSSSNATTQIVAPQQQPNFNNRTSTDFGGISGSPNDGTKNPRRRVIGFKSWDFVW